MKIIIKESLAKKMTDGCLGYRSLVVNNAHTIDLLSMAELKHFLRDYGDFVIRLNYLGDMEMEEN